MNSGKITNLKLANIVLIEMLKLNVYRARHKWRFLPSLGRSFTLRHADLSFNH